jgi:hypothetical protein
MKKAPIVPSDDADRRDTRRWISLLKRRCTVTKRKSPPSPMKAKRPAVPPPDDPLLRGRQDSDLDTREMATKREEVTRLIRKKRPP